MTEDSKRMLQSALGKLLAFDDGAEDILDNLLTIDSKADLSEYLVQLLGGKSEQLEAFVDNVERFQNGEPLVLAARSGVDEAGSSTEEKPRDKQSASASTQNKSQSRSKNEALQSRRNKQQQGKKSRVPPPDRKSPPPSTRSTNSTDKQQQQAAPSNTTSQSKQQNSNSTAPSLAQDTQPPAERRVVPKSHPKRGKATKVCGCFGTKHKPLTNCLYCGRISCVVEGYDFCPFCGLMVEEVTGGANSNDKAWMQKERLLRFDREFARRTEVFDDQADYHQHTAWMTEDEMVDAQDKEEERLQSLRRPKQTMNLAI